MQPVLLPGSVYALGSTGYPRAREMIDAGLPIVLATDFNPGSSPTPSMPMVLSLACTQMKMSPAEAISAATINAAYSLNRGDKNRFARTGKLANFVIFDCEDFREIAYWFGFPQTHSVYVGEQVQKKKKKKQTFLFFRVFRVFRGPTSFPFRSRRPFAHRATINVNLHESGSRE